MSRWDEPLNHAASTPQLTQSNEYAYTPDQGCRSASAQWCSRHKVAAKLSKQRCWCFVHPFLASNSCCGKALDLHLHEVPALADDQPRDGHTVGAPRSARRWKFRAS